jgi:hypothetical protein
MPTTKSTEVGARVRMNSPTSRSSAVCPVTRMRPSATARRRGGRARCCARRRWRGGVGEHREHHDGAAHGGLAEKLHLPESVDRAVVVAADGGVRGRTGARGRHALHRASRRGATRSSGCGRRGRSRAPTRRGGPSGAGEAHHHRRCAWPRWSGKALRVPSPGGPRSAGQDAHVGDGEVEVQEGAREATSRARTGRAPAPGASSPRWRGGARGPVGGHRGRRAPGRRGCAARARPAARAGR